MSQVFVRRVEQLSPSVTDIRSAVRDFDGVILSKRRSSSIQNLEALVKVLVQRAFIDPHEESTWVKLNDMCTKYCGQPFCQPPLTATYQSGPGQLLKYPQCNGSAASPLLHPNGPIVRYLSTRITDSWRSFARGLDVPDGEINAIDKKYKSYEACVRAVLETYEKNMNWASHSNGDIIKDIYSALRLLKGDHFREEFQRVIENLTHV